MDLLHHDFCSVCSNELKLHKVSVAVAAAGWLELKLHKPTTLLWKKIGCQIDTQ